MNLGNPIAMGNTAKIYLHQKKIVKVFRDDLPETESTHEAFKQSYAYSCGLSVPRVLDICKIDGKQAIIMEYIPGSTIGDLVSKNMEQAEKYMKISIGVQRDIHENTADPFESMTKKLSRQIASAIVLRPDQKNALLDRLYGIEYDAKLCHGDFHLFNLIMNGDQVTIIDWVDASAGCICADICRTYLLYTQFSETLAEMYLRIYCENSGLSKDDILTWAPIIAGARLSENVTSEKSERLLRIVNQS